MKFWYAVHTRAHCEAFAGASLEHVGVEVFLPVLKEQKALCGKRNSTTSPLFPGYLFAKFEVPTELRAVSYARGVKSIVKLGGSPCIVDESIIDAIKSQATSGVIEFSENRLSTGQVVRIHEGPLCGLEAVFQKKLDGSSRTVLLLKAMSFHARVILNSKSVANL